MFRLDNLMLKFRASRANGPFSGGLRRLTNPRALSVRVASSAVTHLQEGGYEPTNLATFATETNGFADIVEPVVSLPERGVDLTPLGAPAAAAGPAD
jgi:hypothetical protein